jgi:hypothetical protein
LGKVFKRSGGGRERVEGEEKERVEGSEVIVKNIC